MLIELISAVCFKTAIFLDLYALAYVENRDDGFAYPSQALPETKVRIMLSVYYILILHSRTMKKVYIVSWFCLFFF